MNLPQGSVHTIIRCEFPLLAHWPPISGVISLHREPRASRDFMQKDISQSKIGSGNLHLGGVAGNLFKCAHDKGSTTPQNVHRGFLIGRKIFRITGPVSSSISESPGSPVVSFVPAVAALDEFPIEVWERLRAQVLAKKGAHLLQYASSRGDSDLRKALATYLCDYRGARCHPEQIIIITAGTQQAMMISANGISKSR